MRRLTRFGFDGEIAGTLSKGPAESSNESRTLSDGWPFRSLCEALMPGFGAELVPLGRRWEAPAGDVSEAMGAAAGSDTSEAGAATGGRESVVVGRADSLSWARGVLCAEGAAPST